MSSGEAPGALRSETCGSRLRIPSMRSRASREPWALSRRDGWAPARAGPGEAGGGGGGGEGGGGGAAGGAAGGARGASGGGGGGPPRRITAHRETARVATDLGSVLGEPPDRGQTVRARGLERVLGSAAVADGDDDRATSVGEGAAHAARGVQVAGHEPTAAGPREHPARRATRRPGVDAHGAPAARPADG